MSKLPDSIELHEMAQKFWNTPIYKEKNFQGEDITYTPSQIAQNNRRAAGLFAYKEGIKRGHRIALEGDPSEEVILEIITELDKLSVEYTAGGSDFGLPIYSKEVLAKKVSIFKRKLSWIFR